MKTHSIWSVALRISVLLGLALPIVMVQTEGVGHACAFPAYGDGSAVNPWQIRTVDELACLRPSTVLDRPGGVNIKLMADFDWVTSDGILQPNLLRFDGNGHAITVKNVSGFSGLFGDPVGLTVTDLTVHADNSSLAAAAGWLADDDTNGVYRGILVTGDIPTYGGGVIGGNSSGSRISDCTSTGAIGAYAGGVVGFRATNVRVERCMSTGDITAYGGGIVAMQAWDDVIVETSYSTGYIGDFAGGIAGIAAAWAPGGFMQIMDSFSTGNIGEFAGGIVGLDAAEGTGSVVNIDQSFSIGNVDMYGGGIAGADAAYDLTTTVIANNVYQTGSRVLFAGSVFGSRSLATGNATAINDFGTASPWSDATARATLAGTDMQFGPVWGSCALNTPFFLSAFYPRNPCVAALATDVTVSKPAASVVLSATSVSGPTNDRFSLTSTIASSPLSHVAVVNDTGSVSLDGVDCASATSCVLPDVTQGGGSRGQFQITRNGTVKVQRFDVLTRTTTDVGTLSLSAARSAAPVATPQRSTLSFDGNGGTCQTGSIVVEFGTSVVLPGSDACSWAGKVFAGWNTERSGRGATLRPTASLVLERDTVLYAEWSPIPISTTSQVTIRITRLTRSPEWVKVSGRLAGSPRPKGLVVWFRERDAGAFQRSAAPILRDGMRFTWFHKTSKPVAVYMAADGGVVSRRLRVPAAPTD